MFSNSGFDQSLSNINNNNNNHVTDIYVFMFIPQNNLFDNNCIYIYIQAQAYEAGGHGGSIPPKKFKAEKSGKF